MKIEVDEAIFRDMIETIETLDEGLNCQELTNKARDILRTQVDSDILQFSPEC